MVCVFEAQKRGTYHLHALLGGCPSMDGGVESRRDFQLWGISRWKVFKEGAGAGAYLGSYLVKETLQLYIGLDGPWTESQLRGRKLDKLRC